MSLFGSGLRSWAQLVQDRHRDVKRGVALKLFSAVIKDTPVDTGRLRSNWQTSIGSPDLNTGSTLAREARDKMKLVTGTLEADQAVLMCNSLPYAYRIEYEGWSRTKSPEGMRNRNVLRFQALLKRQVSQSRRQGGALL